jgi:hypothetical protein
VNFQGLGVRDIVDFTEVLDQVGSLGVDAYAYFHACAWVTTADRAHPPASSSAQMLSPLAAVLVACPGRTH